MKVPCSWGAHLKHLHQSLIRNSGVQPSEKQYPGGLLLWQVPHTAQVTNAAGVGQPCCTAQRVGGGVSDGLLQGVLLLLLLLLPSVGSQLAATHDAENVFIRLAVQVLVWLL